MFDSLLATLDQFTPEILVILVGLLVITSTLFLWLWYANRRSFRLLKHQLPASVVKSYLDSIIQNSQALQSSIMRGEVPSSGTPIPQVYPLSGVSGAGEAASGAGDAQLREALNIKNAELAALQSQLSAAVTAKRDLEQKLISTEAKLTSAEARIKELEALLQKAGSEGGAGAGLTQELASITKERDELREKLREYEIIEDDLANLKRLQQENAQLKRTIEQLQGGTPRSAATAAETAPAAVDPLNEVNDLFEEMNESAPASDDTTEQLAEFLGEEAPSEEPAEIAAAEAAPEAPAAQSEKTEKTPEDLLSEFEKMLG